MDLSVKTSDQIRKSKYHLNLPILLIILHLQGHYHEEVKSAVTQNHKFYQGYPGQPEIESSHFIEQSPGFGHPFLPGADSDFDVDHFLWTGDIDSEEENQDVTDEEFVESEDGFRVTSKIYPNIPVIRPTSVLVTREGTVYTSMIQPTPVFVPQGSSSTLAYPDLEGSGLSGLPPGVFPTHDPPASHSQPHPFYEADRSQGGGQQFTNGYYDMPEPQFLIRTVLRNDTDLLRGSVNLQAFREEMEDKLTRTYRQAYTKESEPIRRRRDIQFTDLSNLTQMLVYRGRVIRAAPDLGNVRVRIHNIRSARPEPEIEILYAVYEDEKEPILATEAVKVINDNVNENEVVEILGHPLKIQAEPYLRQEEIRSIKDSSAWMIATSLISLFSAALLIWILIYIYKQKWGGKKKHDILISSAGTSKHASPSAPRRELCDEAGAFTLDRGLAKHPNIDVGRRNRLHSDKSDMSDGKHGQGESGGETPSLADHSGNNTPAGTRKTKLKGVKRRDRRAHRRSGNGLTTSDESEPDSAFPARTPENIKALDDLLEEEVPVPGDSGRGSIYPGHPGWAFLDTPGREGEDWQRAAEDVQKSAALYRDSMDQALPAESSKRKAKSAKSHIFRKDKVAAELTTDEIDRGVPTRPWSAAEPRWSADRMFSSKQKNWEGLAAGRKHLHHGQLLPGSTESTDEDNMPRKTCWSEGASPGRPPLPANMPDPATPLIQAIRSELRRFQRSQNSGVTIVTDPDLLDKESMA